MSATTSADVSLITGTGAGALVPYTAEWVDGSTTATHTLVGQILNNGETNFVGYESGEAYYLLPTSAPGAEATVLADGESYFVSSGDPPEGFLATDGGAAPSQTVSDDDQTITSSPTTAATTGTSTTSESTSATGDESTMETDQPGAGNRLSVFSVGIGMTLFTALVFGVMA